MGRPSAESATVSVANDDSSAHAGLILAGGCCAVVLVTIACAVLGIRNGLRPEQSNEIAALFPRLALKDFLPEPLERAQCVGFFVGTLASAAALIISPPAQPLARAGRMLFQLGFAIAVIVVLGFGTDMVGRSVTWNPIFQELLPSGDKFVPWLCVAFLFLAPFGMKTGRLRTVWIRLLAPALILLVGYYCLETTLIEPVKTVGYDRLNHHEAAVLHPVVQSALGQIPYRDFTPQYGGHGLFVLPFRWITSDAWGQVTLLLAAAKLLTFGFVIGTIYLCTRSLLAGAFGGLTYLWLTHPQAFEPVFQQVPIRTLFPAMFLFIFAALKQRASAAAALTGALTPVALFWNPESGLFAGAATIAAMALWSIADWKNGTAIAPSTRPLVIFLAACLIAGVSLVTLFRLTTGYELRAYDLFKYSALFAQYGFYNLKMPPLDLWVICAFLYCWLLSMPSEIDAFVYRQSILCALMAGALFFYYQGRSVTGNLLVLSFPLIVGVFVRTWTPAGTNPVLPKNAAHMSTLQKAICVGCCLMASLLLIDVSRLPPINNPFASSISNDDNTVAAFVRNASVVQGPVIVISEQAWLIHLISGTPPPLHIPPLAALGSAADEKQMMDALRSGEYKTAIVDETLFDRQQQGPSLLREIATVLAENWKVVETVCVKTGCLKEMRRLPQP